MSRKLRGGRAPTLALAFRQRERGRACQAIAKSCCDATPIHLAQIGRFMRLIRKQVLQWIARQAAKSRFRIPIGPPPHHAPRAEASEEFRAGQPMEAREKSPEHCVFHPIPPPRVGAIAGLPHVHPSDARHRAPH
jgi:hypothetical protein